MLWDVKIYVKTKLKPWKKVFSTMSSLQIHNCILKVNQETGGKWFIHGTKYRKDNQLQSQKHPGRCAQA